MEAEEHEQGARSDPKADSGGRSRESPSVSIWSLVVAALSLTLSVLVLFNGNGLQERFEQDRQRCLDSLVTLTGALREMRYSRLVTPELFARFITGWEFSERSCFGGRIISAGSDFHDVWENSRDRFISDHEAWMLGEVVSSEGGDAFDSHIELMLTITDNVYGTVQEAPGAGVFPWQYPELLDPAVLP